MDVEVVVKLKMTQYVAEAGPKWPIVLRRVGDEVEFEVDETTFRVVLKELSAAVLVLARADRLQSAD